MCVFLCVRVSVYHAESRIPADAQLLGLALRRQRYWERFWRFLLDLALAALMIASLATLAQLSNNGSIADYLNTR